MKEIKLTQGFSVVVDDEDFPRLSAYKWRVQKSKHTNYAVRAEMKKGIRKTISMHRQILGIVGREICVDHINDNGLCNIKSNLRKCSYSQNQSNKRKFGGSSKYKGVFYEKKRDKWRSQISYSNKTFFIGRYQTEKDAAIAFNNAALKVFGEFARLNILD